MATLTGSTISSTYKTLLKTASSTGVTSTLSTVEDGDATASCLKLGTTSLNVDGKVGVNSSTSINANLHIKSTETQTILAEDSSGYDIFYVGDSSSTFDCKIGDIDNASYGNDTYLHLKDSANSIILKGTYTGISQTSPSATLHVGNNDATVKFALTSSTTAMTIGDSSNADIINIDTRNDIVRVEGDLEVTGNFNGQSQRWKHEEYFLQRPGLNADIDITKNLNFEVLGTNASSDDVTFDVNYSGVKIETDGADNDQVIICPHADSNQTALNNMKLLTQDELVFECAITTEGNIANYSFWAGLKKSRVPDYATDTDQAYFLYCSDDDHGALTTNANLHFIYSVSGTDYITNLGITVAVGTTYRLKLSIDADRKIAVFVNGVQYGLTSSTTAGGVTESTSTTLSAALTAGAALFPFIGTQQHAGSTTSTLYVHYEKISRTL